MQPHNEQKKETRNGTEKSTRKPWKSERMTNSSPLVREMMGKVVSIVVAPPDEMGAKGPNQRTIKGAPNNVMTSRMIFANKATVPKSGPRYCVMRMLDNE